MSIDEYLDEKYEITKHNCGHFVTKVWKELTGNDITEICSAFINGDLESYKQKRKNMVHIRGPESPCIVMMQSQHVETHVGIFVNGKVLHLSEVGVRYEPLISLKPYWRMSFYK